MVRAIGVSQVNGAGGACADGLVNCVAVNCERRGESHVEGTRDSEEEAV